MSIQLSELVLDLPPPKLLSQIMQEFDNALLIARHKSYAILIDFPSHNYASEIGGRLKKIPYHGFYLQVAIQRYSLIVKHKELIYSRLTKLHPKAKMLWMQ